jgi:hypothetical protein
LHDLRIFFEPFDALLDGTNNQLNTGHTQFTRLQEPCIISSYLYYEQPQ